MTEGHAETRTRNTRRNGTTCPMAALDVATGTVVGRMVPRHRSQEFLAFLDPVASGIDPATEVHVILDNVFSHKSAEVHEWLRDHPRWRFHFTPTSASWTNAVEGFFARLTRRRLKHAIFNSLDECIDAIEAFIAHHNAKEARPFTWSRQPEDVTGSWKRRYRTIETSRQSHGKNGYQMNESIHLIGKCRPKADGFAVSIPDACMSGSPTRLRDAEPGRMLQLFCTTCKTVKKRKFNWHVKVGICHGALTRIHSMTKVSTEIG